MAAVNIIQSFEDIVGVDTFRKGFMQNIIRHSKADDPAASGPAAGGDRDTKRILFGKLAELLFISPYKSFYFFRVRLVHIGHCTHRQGGIKSESFFNGRPKLVYPV